MWSFSEDRGRNYKDIINGASFTISGVYKETLMSSKTVIRFYNYFTHLMRPYKNCKVKPYKNCKVKPYKNIKIKPYKHYGYTLKNCKARPYNNCNL